MPNVTFFATKNMTKDLQKPLQIEYLSCLIRGWEDNKWG